MNLAILAVAVLVGGSAAEVCSGHYRVPSTAGQVLLDNLQMPYQLALDRDTSTLFFSYTTEDVDSVFKSMYINLEDNTSGPVRGMLNGFAHAYDGQHQIVYIGGRDGIYKFDYTTKMATNLDISESNIWQMFYKNALYFSTYPDEEVFVYKGEQVERLEELKDRKAMMVAVDKDDSIVFVHDGELMRVTDGGIVGIGNYSVNCFNTDADDNLFFSTPNAIYKLSVKVVKKMASFENIFGFVVVGQDQLIYATDSSVVRVTLTADMCGEDNENETFNDV